MLSRSSLETQKLELMSAMSELKLQQAALERENLELRSASHHNNTQNNLNNNNNNNILMSSPLTTTTTITPIRSFGGRPPVPPQSNMNTKYQHGTTLHSSHGNLNQQQNSTASLTSTPKVIIFYKLYFIFINVNFNILRHRQQHIVVKLICYNMVVYHVKHILNYCNKQHQQIVIVQHNYQINSSNNS